MKRGISAILLILIFIILGIGGYAAYKTFILQIAQVIPSPQPTTGATPNANIPIVTNPSANSKVTSPLVVQGIVPPGWMFEGVFPIKLVDSNNKLIVQGQATEEVPGSWQSNVPVNFTATLKFSTSAKSGFIILENDNPSGDPNKDQSFSVPVSF